MEAIWQDLYFVEAREREHDKHEIPGGWCWKEERRAVEQRNGQASCPWLGSNLACIHNQIYAVFDWLWWRDRKSPRLHCYFMLVHYVHVSITARTRHRTPDAIEDYDHLFEREGSWHIGSRVGV